MVPNTADFTESGWSGSSSSLLVAYWIFRYSPKVCSCYEDLWTDFLYEVELFFFFF